MSVQTSPASQRIPWSRRADLRIVPLEFQGQRSWGIKDPVTLDYFELNDEEYFVLQQLNGQMSVTEVCERFCERFHWFDGTFFLKLFYGSIFLLLLL